MGNKSSSPKLQMPVLQKRHYSKKKKAKRFSSKKLAEPSEDRSYQVGGNLEDLDSSRVSDANQQRSISLLRSREQSMQSEDHQGEQRQLRIFSFGMEGAGKSHVFNQLVGKELFNEKSLDDSQESDAGFKRGDFCLPQADATINCIEAFSFPSCDFVFEFEQLGQLLYELKEGFNVALVVVPVSGSAPCSAEQIAKTIRLTHLIVGEENADRMVVLLNVKERMEDVEERQRVMSEYKFAVQHACERYKIMIPPHQIFTFQDSDVFDLRSQILKLLMSFHEYTYPTFYSQYRSLQSQYQSISEYQLVKFIAMGVIELNSVMKILKFRNEQLQGVIEQLRELEGHFKEQEEERLKIEGELLVVKEKVTKDSMEYKQMKNQFRNLNDEAEREFGFLLLSPTNLVNLEQGYSGNERRELEGSWGKTDFDMYRDASCTSLMEVKYAQMLKQEQPKKKLLQGLYPTMKCCPGKML